MLAFLIFGLIYAKCNNIYILCKNLGKSVLHFLRVILIVIKRTMIKDSFKENS